MRTLLPAASDPHVSARLRVSIEALKWAFEQEDVPPAPRFVLVALGNRADETGYCFPSIKWIRRKTGYADSNIRKYLVDLEATGKLEKTHRRREDGGKATNEYRLRLDQPGLQLGHPPSPVAGDTPAALGDAPRLQLAGVPPAAGANKKKQTKASRKQESLVADLPDWLPLEAWEAFVSDRKERKKPLTSRAAKMAIEELAALREQGEDLSAVLRQSIRRGYAGLFAVKRDGLAIAGDWETSNEGIERKGAEVGVPRRDGESASSHRDRIKQRMERRAA